MSYRVKFTSAYKKSRALMIKRGMDISLLKDVVKKLMEGENLELKYRVHSLSGKYFGYHECHIKPDWLLIYYYDYPSQTLVLVDTGTHSDLF